MTDLAGRLPLPTRNDEAVKDHHHHISVMELGHLLTRSGLTCPEVFVKDFMRYIPVFVLRKQVC